METTETTEPHWYAIRSRHAAKTAQQLAEMCEEVFYPVERHVGASGVSRERAVIPHVLFIRSDERSVLELERRSRSDTGGLYPFWIYRYRRGDRIQSISEQNIRLIRLLTADDTSRCEIYTKTDFTPGLTVRVTGGLYKGYTGTVQRVRKNKHVVVEIEGICLVMLPFIHPDLLEPV